MSIAPIYFDGDHGRQDRPLLIFVEGTDDGHFVDVILSEIGADPAEVGIFVVKGNGNFAREIASFKKTRHFRKARGVIILRDADDNPQGAASDINRIFQKEFGTGTTHAKILTAETLKIGFFLFPTENEDGDLEKLCLSTIPDSKIVGAAESYIEAAQGVNNLTTQIYKRKSQVFLAGIAGDLCRGAGLGFKRGFFDAQHVALSPLKTFLKEFITEDVIVAEG